LPDTIIEYPEQVAFCNGNTQSAYVRHAVQLGIYCNDGAREFGFFDDLFFECGAEQDQFDYLDASRLDGSRYTCSETSTFPIGSTASQTQLVHRVSVTTDQTWVLYPDENCYTNSSSPSPPVASPTFTNVPLITSPSKAPATPPASVPSPSVPSNPASDSVVPLNGSTSSQEDKSSTSGGGPSVGAAVGGAIGAIILVFIVVFLAIKRRASRMSGPVQEHKDPGIEPSSTVSETGQNVEKAGNQHQAKVAGQVAMQGAPVLARPPPSQELPQLKDDPVRSVVVGDTPSVSGLTHSLGSQQSGQSSVSALTQSFGSQPPTGQPSVSALTQSFGSQQSGQPSVSGLTQSLGSQQSGQPSVSALTQSFGSQQSGQLSELPQKERPAYRQKQDP
jgi:hypothetical protein